MTKSDSFDIVLPHEILFSICILELNISSINNVIPEYVSVSNSMLPTDNSGKQNSL